MITYKMHFIRTGKTSNGPGRQYVGQLDLPLSDEGTQELEALQSKFDYPAVQAVFVSPLDRCIQTADLLYPDTWQLTVDDLADMDLGDFAGSRFEELQGDEAFLRWLDNSRENPPPGGEDADSFQSRIVRAVAGIFRAMMDEKLQNVAVITHGGVIMSLLAGIALPKRPLQQWMTPNGQGYTLLFTPQMWMRDGCAEVYGPVPLSADQQADNPERFFS